MTAYTKFELGCCLDFPVRRRRIAMAHPRMVWVVLFLFGIGFRSRAEGDESSIVKNLYLALTSNEPVTAGSCGIIMNPGVALDPWLETQDALGSSRLGELNDKAFQANWIYTPSGRSIAKTYADILNIAQWALVPLTPRQRKDLSDVERLLFADPTTKKPTADYQQYLDLKRNRDDLQRRFDNAAPQDRDAVGAQLSEAKDDLKLRGQEALFVAALGKLSALQFVKPADWGLDLNRRYAVAVQGAMNGTGPTATCAPSIASLVTAPTWTEITLTGADLTRDTSSAVFIGPEPAQLLMLHWGQGATSTASDAAGDSSTITNDTTVTFEFAVVSLDRPWMDSKLFQSRVWRYPPDSKIEQISDGVTPSKETAPTGQMPLLATQAILARHIRICGALGAESLKKLRSQIAEGKAANWGPFLLSGRYYQQTDGRPFCAEPYLNGVRCDEVQIVGWIAQVLPQSPNPDPSFFWGLPVPPK